MSKFIINPKGSLKSILTKEFLEKEYLVKQKSMNLIANEVNCNPESIRKYLIKFNIQRRPDYIAGPMVSYTGYGKINGSTWAQIINGFLKRKDRLKDFTIKVDQAWELFEQQNEKCYYSNEILTFPKNNYEECNGFRTASLDRIDSSRGYTIENIKWVHKRINLMKYDFTHHYFIGLCKTVCANNNLIKHPLQVTKIENPKLTKSVFTVIFNKHKEYNIDLEYLQNLINKQQYKCAISGKQLYFPSSVKELTGRLRTGSLDRIDNNLSYIKGNVQWVHTDINHSRWNLSVSDYINWCYKVAANENCI